MLNEEVDPSLIIRRLKQEIRDLREEMRLVKGEAEDRGPLTPDEIKRLSEQHCKRRGAHSQQGDGPGLELIKRDATKESWRLGLKGEKKPAFGGFEQNTTPMA
eukprot:scaffold24315_cov21-Tisochrysis_lutea.AAC.4